MLACVAAFQFGFSYLTNGVVNDSLTTAWPLYGWVFLTVTLPVYLYFVLSERSKSHATIGKKVLGLKVVANNGELTIRKSFMRNVIKVSIPWESAHIVLFFPTPILTQPSSGEVRMTLFIPYIIFGIYGAYLWANKGCKTLHDAVAGTSVVSIKHDKSAGLLHN